MTARLASLPVDVPLALCRVQDSVVVHLVHDAASGRADEALCGGTVLPGRPERLFVQSPCVACLREADEQGLRTVRDLTTAWINLSRLAAWLRAAA